MIYVKCRQCNLEITSDIDSPFPHFITVSNSCIPRMYITDIYLVHLVASFVYMPPMTRRTNE